VTDLLNWRLPDGVEDLLPPEAAALEALRRRVLDVFRAWGFEYIEPPVIEYLDALLVGSGGDLDLQTLKVVDQRSGRLLGVRADMTAQAARIDAHVLGARGVQRLCYAGTVVHANPSEVLDSRIPFKAGAEIFGAADLAADAEVIDLLQAVLAAGGITRPVLVLGHVGIYQQLVQPLELTPTAERALFAAVQGKSQTDIATILGDRPGAAQWVQLPTLMGRREVLPRARDCLQGAPAAVFSALQSLETLADVVQARAPGLDLRFDLAELAGYGYHTGPVFTAYQDERGNARARGSAIARGGRFDGVGAAFGQSGRRAATGFDVNLKLMLDGSAEAAPAIWAPLPSSAEARHDTERSARIRALRAAGEIVVAALAVDEVPPGRCDRMLVHTGGRWSVEPR
jgi:ATP phosphoribosyltransferase regulatory subunit